MAAKSRTALFYAKNPEARAKKNRYQASFNKRPDQVKKRVALNAFNRKHKSTATDDAVHKGKKIVGFAHQSKNRGDKDDSAGDRRARGKRVVRRKK